MLDDFDNEEGKTFAEKIAESDISAKLPRGYISVSQVTQFLKCGMAYYFRYVEDWTVPANNFTIQGRGIHKAAETLHLALISEDTPDKLPSAEELSAVYSDLHDKEVAENAVLIDEKDWGFVKDEGIRLTKLYRKGALGDVTDPDTGFPMVPVKPVAAERVVKVLLQPEDSAPIPFLGVIDLEEDTGIADLKNKKKAATQADVDNSLQLTLYAHILGKPTVRMDQLVKPTKTIGPRYLRKTSTRTSKDAKHALNVVRDMTAAVTAGNFMRTNPENWWCSEKWCAYWGSCRGK